MSAANDPPSPVSAADEGHPSGGAPTVPAGQDSSPVAPRWNGRAPLLVLLAVGGVFLALALQMEWGSLAEPGPGLWPTIVAVVLVVITLAALVVENGRYAEKFTVDSGRALVGFVLLVATAWAFSYVGLILAGTLFLLIWLRFLSDESWRLSIPVAVAAPLACHALFVVALGVYLPDDVVAQLWGGR